MINTQYDKLMGPASELNYFWLQELQIKNNHLQFIQLVLSRDTAIVPQAMYFFQ